LILRVELPAPAVFRPQVLIRERRLRVVVTPPVPGVAGSGVEVPPVVLHVLAVVRLGAGQPEDTLLEDRITAVPQREAETEPLLDVAEAGQAVLTPPVSPGPRMVMRQVIPGLTVRAVVFPDRPPLPLADIRPPQVPGTGLAQPILEMPEPVDPFAFRACRRRAVAVLPALADRHHCLPSLDTSLPAAISANIPYGRAPLGEPR